MATPQSATISAKKSPIVRVPLKTRSFFIERAIDLKNKNNEKAFRSAFSVKALNVFTRADPCS